MAETLTIIAEFGTTPETYDKFLEMCYYDSERSIADEAGCLEFTVLTPQDEGNTVVLYEVYTGRTGFDAHLQTPHFQKFSSAVRDLKIEQRSVRFFNKRSS
ncbi:hypothetical protein AA101099_2521 [Neoasaia chiangmaiensis NBRC 101099]|uniref:Antibiotic biosynthesis monooxygenase n=1 Tax=Neoasaia chiangmaiensis TaxID=320497 RepID=A0A1U9KPS4_9PROT|nr:putative quinol monooxygenase [Neoasaia chiangmaiensis]AQS87797.1 antibiotic biosynthesis monooxygenase [Neoasaia chiangmaiensis]GBR41530.1 hypothetical protein AA101099_2521 [Neoasaia chiangmaiensis NBRC 101099]GEN14402.1 hypothetical protein NCH01_08330 [Neoasaia chiangmaiensis]